MLTELTQQYRFTEEIMRFQTIRVENIEEESEKFIELYPIAQEAESAHPTEATAPVEEKENKTKEEAKPTEPPSEELGGKEAESSKEEDNGP